MGGWLLDIQRHFSLKYREWSHGLLVNYVPSRWQAGANSSQGTEQIDPN